MTNIPLRWVKNDEDSARTFFGPTRGTPEFTYLGAPILADFELTYGNLAPYVREVLDQAAPLEGAGISVKLVEIKKGKVKVW